MEDCEEYTASQRMNHSPETSINPTANAGRALLSASRHGKVGVQLGQCRLSSPTRSSLRGFSSQLHLLSRMARGL